MELLTWRNQLSVGVDEIDAEHRELIGIINRLGQALRATNRAVGEQVLDELLAYAREHFAHEERLMDEHDFERAEAHRREHRHLIERITRMQALAAEGRLDFSIDLIQFLNEWLREHIVEVDKRLGAHLNSVGVK